MGLPKTQVSLQSAKFAATGRLSLCCLATAATDKKLDPSGPDGRKPTSPISGGHEPAQYEALSYAAVRLRTLDGMARVVGGAPLLPPGGPLSAAAPWPSFAAIGKLCVLRSTTSAAPPASALASGYYESPRRPCVLCRTGRAAPPSKSSSQFGRTFSS
jgi:hypothetical protein